MMQGSLAPTTRVVFEAYQREVQRTVRALKADVDDLKDAVLVLNGDVRDLTKEITALRKRVAELESRP